MKGVEHDLGGIVGENVLPAGHARPDFLQFVIPANKDGVQVALVVGEVNVCALRRLGSICRLARNEASYL